MVEYIPLGIFRSSFKFCMGDKLREKMEGGKGMKRFSVHFYLDKPIQIVFLKTLKIVGPLSKMKPCTRRVPKIGKKTLESCTVQNIDYQVTAVNGTHMKEYKNKWQTTA
jgi:hypothetical protein